MKIIIECLVVVMEISDGHLTFARLFNLKFAKFDVNEMEHKI